MWPDWEIPNFTSMEERKDPHPKSDTEPQLPVVPAKPSQSRPGKPTAVRRFLAWSATVLLALAILLNWFVLVVLIAALAIAGLVWFVAKFRRDNKDLVPGPSRPRRFVVSAFFGLVRFIPGLMIISLAVGIAFGVDHVVNWGLGHVRTWAESAELITFDKPTTVERHRLSPWRLFGIEKKVVIEKVEISKEKSELTKMFVRTAVNLVELVLLYPWVLLSFFTLQCYFYFWARAFVAGGGEITMQFPKYQA